MKDKENLHRVHLEADETLELGIPGGDIAIKYHPDHSKYSLTDDMRIGLNHEKLRINQEIRQLEVEIRNHKLSLDLFETRRSTFDPGETPFELIDRIDKLKGLISDKKDAIDNLMRDYYHYS